MSDVASLLDSLDLSCCRCGRRGPDTFTDLAGLEAFLGRPTIPVLVAGIVPPAAAIRTIHPGDVERFGPVHRACLRPRPPRPAAERPPYDLSRSVA